MIDSLQIHVDRLVPRLRLPLLCGRRFESDSRIVNNEIQPAEVLVHTHEGSCNRSFVRYIDFQRQRSRSRRGLWRDIKNGDPGLLPGKCLNNGSANTVALARHHSDIPADPETLHSVSPMNSPDNSALPQGAGKPL